jgi:hypothetical protein
MNRYFNSAATSFLVSGNAPIQNSLMFWNVAALRANGFGKLVAVPGGYGAPNSGLAPAITAGDVSAFVSTSGLGSLAGSGAEGRSIIGASGGSVSLTGGVIGLLWCTGLSAADSSALASALGIGRVQGQAGGSGLSDAQSFALGWADAVLSGSGAGAGAGYLIVGVSAAADGLGGASGSPYALAWGSGAAAALGSTNAAVTGLGFIGGSVPGVSTATAAASALVEIAGLLAGIGGVTAELILVVGGPGLSAGAGSVSADVTGLVEVSGSAPGSATGAGSVVGMFLSTGSAAGFGDASMSDTFAYGWLLATASGAAVALLDPYAFGFMDGTTAAGETGFDDINAAIDAATAAILAAIGDIEGGGGGGGGGLTAQETRDTGLLAPSAGVPAAGSIDKHLDDLLSLLQIVRQATSHLDTTAVIRQTPGSSAGHLTITAFLTFDEAISDLDIPIDWTLAYWTLKSKVRDDDADSILQLVASNPAAGTDGLQIVNGGAPASASLGTLTVDQANGRVSIFLQDDLTALLAEGAILGWDVKFFNPDSETVGRRGTADVVLTETRTI